MKHFLYILAGSFFWQFTDSIAISCHASTDRFLDSATFIMDKFPLCEILVIILTPCLVVTLYKFLRQRRHSTVLRHRSEEQLRLLRCLLDLCYTYRESPAVFLDKFKDKVNIRELKSYGLIGRNKRRFSGLKEDERLLCQLLEAGFTHRELSVIFNLKKSSNLYTKYHRIQQKLTDPKPYGPSTTENC